jgi:hypothetical protein
VHNLLVITYENDYEVAETFENLRASEFFQRLNTKVQAMLVGPVYGLNGVTSVVLYPHGGEPDFDVATDWNKLALQLKTIVRSQLGRHVLEVAYGYDHEAQVVEDDST